MRDPESSDVTLFCPRERISFGVGKDSTMTKVGSGLKTIVHDPKEWISATPCSRKRLPNWQHVRYCLFGSTKCDTPFLVPKSYQGLGWCKVRYHTCGCCDLHGYHHPRPGVSSWINRQFLHIISMLGHASFGAEPRYPAPECHLYGLLW